MKFDNSSWINHAIATFNKGNLPQADILCRHMINSGIKHPVVYEILGHIARRMQRHDMAVHYFQCAIDIDPHCQPAIKAKAEDSIALEKPQGSVAPLQDAYLLIKAWGYGFWSDVDHVLGQLLLAEMTGRTPVVHWSNTSLFSDGSGSNAFQFFFEPISEYSIDDLAKPKFSYFPPKWSVENLHQENINKFGGEHSRMAGLYYLNRPENVLVSDFHTYVSDLVQWIPSVHPMHGKDCASIYRYLCAKYLRVTANIRDEIEAFHQAFLAGKNCLAVHLRGSDKQIESLDLASVNATYHQAIEKYLDKESGLKIFLLTDYQPYLEEYNARYPGMIITTDCTRTSTNTGVHLQSGGDKVRKGIEVLMDAYLAAGCKYFIGNGRSSVSIAVTHLKNWQKDRYTLLDGSTLYKPRFFLHDW